MTTLKVEISENIKFSTNIQFKTVLLHIVNKVIPVYMLKKIRIIMKVLANPDMELTQSK